MKISARKAIGVSVTALMGVGLAAMIGLSSATAQPPPAGAPPAAGGAPRPARPISPSPAVPAAPLKAFTKVKSPKDIGGVWLIYSTGSSPGSTGPYGNPPTSAAGKAKVDAFTAKYDPAALKAHPPNQSCVEPGMPSAMGGIGLVPMEIHVAPDRITLMSEVGPITRRIYMNGKKAPDGYPTSRSGWSNAHWEGDTLVITTTLLSDWYLGRWNHTEDAVVTERLTLRNTADFGTTIPRNQPLDPLDPVGPLTLVSEMSMHDPALYDVDPHTTLYFRHMPDDEFQEVSCVEGLFWEAMNTQWRKPEAGAAAIPASAGAANLLQGPPRGGGGGGGGGAAAGGGRGGAPTPAGGAPRP